MVKKNRKNKAKITDIERERYHGPLVTQGVSLGISMDCFSINWFSVCEWNL